MITYAKQPILMIDKGNVNIANKHTDVRRSSSEYTE